MALAKDHDDSWHEERATRVGGSDIPSLCCADAFKSPAAIWRSKIGHREPYRPNNFMERGAELEGIAIKLWGYLRSTKQRLVKPMCGRSHVLCKHPKYDFMGVLFDAVSEDMRHACEIKTLSPQNHEKLLNGEPVKGRVLCQVQYQMLVSGREEMDLVFFSGSKDINSILVRVKYDKEFCEELERRVIKFWKMVEDFEEPSRKDFPVLDVPQNIIERIMFE